LKMTKGNMQLCGKLVHEVTILKKLRGGTGWEGGRSSGCFFCFSSFLFFFFFSCYFKIKHKIQC
jgi:hypothetical protein